MKEYLVRKGLVLAFIFFFMVSVITPMTLGYNVRISDEKIITKEELKQSLNAPLDSEWPMYQHDMAHTGYSYSLSMSKPQMLSFEENILYVDGSGNPPIANFTIKNDSDIGVVTFDGSFSYDIDGEIVSYEWDYGDGTTDEGAYGWHQYCDNRIFYVTLTVTDNDGLTGNLTKSVEILLVNCIPTVKIDGPNSGNAGVEYVYTFVVRDVYYETDYFLLVEWGDGETTGWIGIPTLWVPVYLRHRWSENGKYTIRATPKDYCRVGPWDELTVIITRNKATSNVLFLRFLERFPILQSLLQRLRLQ